MRDRWTIGESAELMVLAIRARRCGEDQLARIFDALALDDPGAIHRLYWYALQDDRPDRAARFAQAALALV